ncbi:MAG: DUF819 family protein [Firmicutes bacterium]|nr:DUF819 family protein [Bacillota bacterium]
MQVLQVVFYLVMPYFITKALEKWKKLGIISPILLCYVIGIILGNLSFLPIDRQLAFSLSEYSVPVAIPLILFATDFKSWFRLAKKTIISFLLVIVAAMASALLAGYLFAGLVDEYWKISGMLIGVYTGGTPNLMAIGMGLKVNEGTLILTNTADAILGGLYFLFLITGAKWLSSRFLPAFTGTSPAPQVAATKEETGRWSLVFAVLLSLVIVALSVATSIVLTGRIEVSVVMLMLTTLGIAASFLRKVREIPGTYEAGQYALLVFSLALGTNINLHELVASSSLVFLYTAFVMTTAIIIHFVLAYFFRIDTDTAIITSTAGIFGPAFIGPVAEALDNREVIIPGLTCGLVGYAVGNYLGFAIAWLLMP